MKRHTPARRRPATLFILAIAVLTFASSAAADKNKMQIRYTAEGQAAARAAVVQKADFGGVAGWTGGAKEPDMSPDPPCNGYEPKQSDLVVNGAAKTVWTHPGTQVESDSAVLQTPRMVQLDWQRMMHTPNLLSCLRDAFKSGAPADVKLVLLRRISFPRVAPYVAAFRILTDYTAKGSTIRMMVDMVLFGRGRSEVTLMLTGPYLAEPAMRGAEIRFAQTIVARMRV